MALEETKKDRQKIGTEVRRQLLLLGHSRSIGDMIKKGITEDAIGARSVPDLAGESDEALLSIRSFGRKKLDELRSRLPWQGPPRLTP